MRLTVGPLPPAVYWRRRAVVLGAGLLFLIVLLYSCNRPGNGGTTSQSGATPTPTVSAPGDGESPTPDPSGSVLSPQTGAPPADGSGDDAGSAGDSGSSSDAGGNDAPGGSNAAGGNNAPVANDGTCTDAEISLTPVPLPATAQRGTIVGLQFKIKNKSNRTCNRDVGADMQELFIKSGAEVVWSSDTCGEGKGSSVESFTPGFERSYQVDWNGRHSNKCAHGLATGEYASPGTYQLFGRLDTKLSEPVKLTITG